MKFIVDRSNEHRAKKENKPCDKAIFNEKVMVWEIEINTLEELINFHKEIKEPLIIETHGRNETERLFLEIYDSYRE